MVHLIDRSGSSSVTKVLVQFSWHTCYLLLFSVVVSKLSEIWKRRLEI